MGTDGSSFELIPPPHWWSQLHQWDSCRIVSDLRCGAHQKQEVINIHSKKTHFTSPNSSNHQILHYWMIHSNILEQSVNLLLLRCNLLWGYTKTRDIQSEFIWHLNASPGPLQMMCTCLLRRSHLWGWNTPGGDFHFWEGWFCVLSKVSCYHCYNILVP